MDIPDTLVTAQATLAQARRGYRAAWETYVRGLPPLPRDTFWTVAGDLTTLVLARTESAHQDPVRAGVYELFRLEAAGQSPWDFPTLVSFGVAWGDLGDALSTALSWVVRGYSGDCFADLCDSLPFAGREFCVRCLASRRAPGVPTTRPRFLVSAEFRAALARLPPAVRRLVEGANDVGPTLTCQAYVWSIMKAQKAGRASRAVYDLTPGPAPTDGRDDF